MGMWERPDENSIEGLLHGMEFSDGVELDLRVDGDGEFVIFHHEGLIEGRFHSFRVDQRCWLNEGWQWSEGLFGDGNDLVHHPFFLGLVEVEVGIVVIVAFIYIDV